MKGLLIAVLLAIGVLSWVPVGAQVLLQDDFESGMTGWSVFPGVPPGSPSCTPLDWVSDKNVVPSGSGHCVYADLSQDKIYRDLSVKSSTRFWATWHLYDDTMTRAYAEVRGYTSGGGANGNTGLAQLYAAGKYNSVSMAGETWVGTKYQARVMSGLYAGWFNLNATGSPNRSAGWHRFDVESPGNGFVRFYVDGILSRTISDVNIQGVGTVTLGFGTSSASNGNAWYDGVSVSNLEVNTLALNVNENTRYVGYGDVVSISMDAAALAQKVNGCQALLGYANYYLFAQSGCVAPGGGPWDQLIYNSWDMAQGVPGEINAAIGVNAQGAVGTDAAGPVASVQLIARDKDGVTQVVFLPDESDVRSTRFSDTAIPPNFITPYKVDSQTIVIDGTPPSCVLTRAYQGSNELLNTMTPAIQGIVHITVDASDNLSGFPQAPILFVKDSTSAPVAAAFVNQSPMGTYNYTCTIGPGTANGVATITTRATDRSGNQTTDTGTIFINKNQITGSIESQGFVGGVRSVTFTANGGSQTWTVPVTFAGTTGSYVLTDVAEGITSLSAKTNWSLREKLSVSFVGGQAVADFIGDGVAGWSDLADHYLRGGDINNTNSINVLDYATMKSSWGGGTVGDIDGDGGTGPIDYDIMKANWLKAGDAL